MGGQRNAVGPKNPGAAKGAAKGAKKKADLGKDPRKYDKHFKGPAGKRECRDVWMLPIYIAFWVGLIIIAIKAVKKGDPYRLIYGYDSFGNTCGTRNDGAPVPNCNSTNCGLDLSSAPRLLYFDATDQAALKLCVETCPQEDNCGSMLALLGGSATGMCDEIAVDSGWCLHDGSGGAGMYSSDTEQWNARYGADEQGCPKRTMASQLLMNRCLPLPVAAVSGMLDSAMDAINADGMAASFVNDLQKAKTPLIVLSVVAVILAFTMTLLLRFLAKIIIWVVYYGLIILSIGLMVWLWVLYARSNAELSAGGGGDGGSTSSIASIDALPSAKKDASTFLALAIGWTVIGALITILLVVMHGRIALVVALFTEASKCIGSMPFILAIPLMTLALGTLVVAYFMGMAMFLVSSGDPAVDENGHVSFVMSRSLQAWTWYHVLGFFWTFQFVMAYQETVIAAAAAKWYFAKPNAHGTKGLHFTITRSMYRTLRYSAGSLLLGSFIVAIVQLIRLLVAVFEKQILDKCGGDNHKAKYIIKCVHCCLWCIEKCLKFINRNAYIEIAISGSSFCVSAQRAFHLLVRNALRVVAINSIGDLVLFVTKALISGLMVFFAFAWFEKIDGAPPSIFSAAATAAPPPPPAAAANLSNVLLNATAGTLAAPITDGLHWESAMIVLVGLFGWFIAAMFLGVFEMVIDTIFICFCEDTERNDGSLQKPYFMSANLLRFMAAEERSSQARAKRDFEKAKEVHDKAAGLNLDPASPTSAAKGKAATGAAKGASFA